MYKAKESPFIWIAWIVLALMYGSVLDNGFQYIAYASIILFLAFLTISYEFEVKEGRLLYRTLILRKVIGTREFQVTDIKKISFIKFAKRTLIVIHPKKGLRIKLKRFEPAGLSEEMLEFSNEHDIDKEVFGKMS
ncbi:hypothetical protein [Halalkalibacter hemicellulosilyticus]|uniref:Uncharacterized protein n=1 Tax=Halalkalibacter hemicellulosilyticusJCM 9152 TaxID=1236971 RepID=W4QFA4_9BACI|nr:hypothetical protein [Halalkalibacter hemicellulosilyticus]GAE30333.1 hypothetical protein JCM9152_1738 [Halalkalibacter hemicellulosilyticusJCM 9152]